MASPYSPTRILIAAATLAVAAGCTDQAPPLAPPIPVTVWKAVPAAETGELRYSANIRPDVEVDLAFKVGGYVEDILEVTGADQRRRRVQEGDHVRKGTVLARVRDVEYRDRVTEAQAALTRAKADFSRAARLYENQSIAKADYDASYATLTSAQARFDQAVQTLGDCQLVAPMDGWILARSLEVGALANPGIAAFVLADTRAVKAVFGVPDIVVGEMHIGDLQSVTTEAMPGVELRGSITRVAPAADPTSRVFEIECTIPNPDNRLKVGMIASLALHSGAASPSAILLPINTVVRPRNERSGYAVFLVADEGGKQVARERRLELGDVVGNSVAAVSGLEGGENVIVRGATIVVDGAEVRVIP
jgi:RND family efflux transporter MFP subunit